MQSQLVLRLLAPRCRQVRLAGVRRLSVRPSPDSLVHSGPLGLSYMHNPGSNPLLYLTLGQLAEQAARRYGQREAVVSLEEGVRLTYSQLLDEADRFAAGLTRLGLQPGDKVAIWSPNSWRWIVTKIGVARAGCVSVDLNPNYLQKEVEHCLSLARVTAVVAAEQHHSIVYHKILAAIAPELLHSEPGRIHSTSLPDLRTVISLSDSPPPGCVTYDDVVKSALPDDINSLAQLEKTVSADADSFVQFSSGTTGRPKAIILSHVGAVNNGYYNGKRFGLFEKPHSFCLQTPLFHVYGSIVVMSSAINYGATIVLPSASYNPKLAVMAALKERCTVMTGTPTMYVDLMRAVQKEGVSLESVELAITGGAPTTPELMRRMKTILGVQRICSVYGLSETTAVVFQGTPNDTEEQVCATVGLVGEHVEAKVVDTEGKMVPFGTPGELWVRGYFTMKEYFQNPKATEESLDGGWLKTGDKFVLHENGYGRIVGRMKDMIIRGGENIYPKEVEDLLTTHPDIREAEVVSVPDERLGEDLCACIKVRDGAAVSASSLGAFLRGKISHFKIPRYTITLDDFPKTASGKIQKFLLRDECARLLAEGKLDDAKRGGKREADEERRSSL